MLLADALVKSHFDLIPSFLRKQESGKFNWFWTPASAGVTVRGLLTSLS